MHTLVILTPVCVCVGGGGGGGGGEGVASNEYQQHMFSWRNKKVINIFGIADPDQTAPRIN